MFKEVLDRIKVAQLKLNYIVTGRTPLDELRESDLDAIGALLWKARSEEQHELRGEEHEWIEIERCMATLSTSITRMYTAMQNMVSGYPTVARLTEKMPGEIIDAISSLESALNKLEGPTVSFARLKHRVEQIGAHFYAEEHAHAKHLVEEIAVSQGLKRDNILLDKFIKSAKGDIHRLLKHILISIDTPVQVVSLLNECKQELKVYHQSRNEVKRQELLDHVSFTAGILRVAETNLDNYQQAIRQFKRETGNLHW